MIEAFTSFLNNYKSKIRNPLMGTIISVWIIHNWQIVYALFNFDNDCTMQERINFIQDYFSKKNFWWELSIIICIAFTVIIITFILLAISRFLTDSYYKVIEPWIKGKVSKNEIFTIQEKKNLDSKINELNSNIERLRNAKSNLENQNIFLLNRNDDIQKKYDGNLLELSQQSVKATTNYESLEKKQIPANKIVKFFDEIINALSDEIKNEISIYIEHRENINKNQYKNFIGLKNELEKIGIVINVKGESKTPAIGILFLEYFKEFKDPKLPF